MISFKSNPFITQSALGDLKGEFTCPNCNGKFEDKIQKFKDASVGVICPKCGRIEVKVPSLTTRTG